MRKSAYSVSRLTTTHPSPVVSGNWESSTGVMFVMAEDLNMDRGNRGLAGWLVAVCWK